MVELRCVSRYPRLRRLIAPHEIGRLVGRLHRHAVILDSLPTIEASIDPDDNPLITTAVAGNAEFLVTGDKSDRLGLGKVRGVTFVTARYFVEMLEK